MKRILLCLLFLFCVCGCGKKLTCTYEEDYEDIQIRNKMVFNFKDNTYQQIDKMIFQNEESAEDYFEDVSDYIEEYNLVLNDNIIVSELEDSFGDEKSKKEIKEQYESYDYECR
ncbi:MAG: hypothetical protein IJY25_03140 [Bacilli bacterium]|nr:hypothetical protein [Bacilli bacterium]